MLAEPTDAQCFPCPCTMQPPCVLMCDCAMGVSMLWTEGGGWQPSAMSEPSEEGFSGLTGEKMASLPMHLVGKGSLPQAEGGWGCLG